MRRTSTILAAAALLAALVVVPASADETIFTGLDFWTTPSGGGQVTASLPAGLFCNGTSGAFTATIPLRGRPLVTNPATAITPTDTVVDRPADIGFGGTLQAIGNLHMRALDLIGITSFSVDCSQWSSSSVVELYSVRVHLDGTPQSLGWIVINRPFVGAPGGTFSAQFPVDAVVRLRNLATNQNLPPVPDSVTITTLDACWSHTPAPGSITHSGPLGLDTNGTRTVDYTSPYGTSNFFAGYCNNGIDPPSVEPVEHDGPHPVTCSDPDVNCPDDPPPPNPCDTATRQLLADSLVSGGFDLSSTRINQTADASLSFKRAVRCAEIEGPVIIDQVRAQEVEEVPVFGEDETVGTLP